MSNDYADPGAAFDAMSPSREPATPEPALPEQMRAAADVIDTVNTKLGGPINGHWRPSELRAEADQVEAEEREAAERVTQTEELARELLGAWGGQTWDTLTKESQDYWSTKARLLIENGWRKDGAA